MGLSKRSHNRKIHSITGLSQEIIKISDKQLTFHLEELEKEQQTKPKVSRMKKITQVSADINKIVSKKHKNQ